jgi:murein DD-endopeptidase MepM/ murein hydrolase activator NlpD
VVRALRAGRHRAAALGVGIVFLGALATSATGAEVALPEPPVTIAEEPPPPPPEAPPPPVASPAPTPVKPATPAKKRPRARYRTLKIGRRGADVKALQRALRRRKHRIAVDGVFGRRTKRAVKRQQKRFKWRANGVARPRFQRKLRLKPRWRPSKKNEAGARYLRVFPVAANYTYWDNFGDPRPQGSHQGIDIMAPKGTLIVAPVGGTITRLSRVERGLGGKWIWQRDSRGNDYYYAHLHSIAKGVKPGTKVKAGQVIATVGMTGDARGTVPHLHMEVQRDGRASVNFYSDLVAVDPERKASNRK